ncbi:type II toxin-antitoxin system VapC family toxin [Archaeoglobus sp.]
MEKVCLDTDVLIDLLRGKQDVVERVRELEERCEITTTSITLFELYYGAFKVGREKNVMAVRELARRIEVLEFTEKDAELAGKMSAELDRSGEGLDFRDVLIAAISVNRGAKLYTGNLRHFKRLEKFGLRLKD